MGFYPINVQLAGRRCAVVGGGAVAERKVMSLLQAGACVTLFSPEATPDLARLAAEGKVEYVARRYCPGDLKKFFLVICATDDRHTNRTAAREALSAGALVNAVDAPDEGNFTVAAAIRRGDLLFAVATGGKSPGLARQLRQEIAARYDQEYGVYLDLLARQRTKRLAEPSAAGAGDYLPGTPAREEIVRLIRQGRIKEAEEKITHAFSGFGTES